MITELKIPRDKLRRGGRRHEPEHGTPKLLNRQGNMCCLGHLCQALGVPRDSMLNVPHPIRLGPQYVDAINSQIGMSNSWIIRAMQINDTSEFRSREREQLLVEHFKSIGIDLSFYDDGTP